MKSESSSVGRARPCQGRGREFESRLSLQKALEKGLCCLKVTYSSSRVSRDGGIGRHARLKILWLHGRAGSIPAPGTIQAASVMKRYQGRYFGFGRKIFEIRKENFGVNEQTKSIHQ
jgi:hypothetical protein